MKLYRSLKEKIGNKFHLVKNNIPKDMMDIINEYKIKSLKEGNFYLLASHYMEDIINNPNMDLKNKRYFLNLFKDWDDIGSIPLELGQDIEKMINDPSISLGIHRTKIVGYPNVIESSTLNSIFNDGLINTGHLSSGAIIEGENNPSNVISGLTSILLADIFLKTCYKESNGGILVAFPNNLVSKDMSLVDDHSSKVIYQQQNDNLYIKPEYLLGFVEQQNGVCKYYPKETFQKERSK